MLPWMKFKFKIKQHLTMNNFQKLYKIHLNFQHAVFFFLSQLFLYFLEILTTATFGHIEGKDPEDFDLYVKSSLYHTAKKFRVYYKNQCYCLGK
jgi:hypothetical protein